VGEQQNRMVRDFCCTIMMPIRPKVLRFLLQPPAGMYHIAQGTSFEVS
jgi:hypothetical protein